MGGQTVLVVEDDYFIAADIAAALEARGARVLGPTPSAEGALGWLAEGRQVDAAVLDIDLGGTQAFAVAEALDARGVPFVFASGHDRAAIPPRFAGRPLWEKPFDADRLARALVEPRPAAPEGPAGAAP